MNSLNPVMRIRQQFAGRKANSHGETVTVDEGRADWSIRWRVPG